MRYYVLCTSDHEGIDPHVVAEVVRSADDGNSREFTLAASLAGRRARVVTRDELRASAAGRRALVAWDSGDDAQFDNESNAILTGADDEAPSFLRLVATNDRSEDAEAYDGKLRLVRGEDGTHPGRAPHYR